MPKRANDQPIRVGSYIKENLPEDLYPGEPNDAVVIHYRKKDCSFDQVLIRFHYLVVGKALKDLPGMDSDDIYQEFVMALEHCCHKWDPDKGVSFVTYLYKTLERHRCWILRKQLTTFREANYGTVSLDEPAESEPEDSNEVRYKYEISVELEEPVEFILMGLPISDRERRFLVLILQGYSPSDISRIEGLTRSRVSQILGEVGKRLSRIK